MGSLQKYSYAYDHMNRFLRASYQKPETTFHFPGSYDERVSYDKNGNITYLERTGEYDDMSYNLLIDDLTYTYSTTNPNLLIKVDDATNNPNGFKNGSNISSADDYLYDAYGNMTVDHNKGITEIKYNHLNLPVKITFATTGNIEYLYNAGGVKVRKIVTDGSDVRTTDYLNGFQYVNNNMEFFPHAEGYVKKTMASYNYVFNYTDHLGNIRLSYTKNPITNVLTILEENNYYPFGLKHQNYNMTKRQYDKDGGNIVITPTNLTVYDYKYNGKEWQDELSLNMYDMDMRQYDPAIARWVVQDPVIHHDFSPYNAFDNNPVFWADPSGADSERDYMGRDRFDSYGRFIAPNDRGQANFDSGISGSEGRGGHNKGVLNNGNSNSMQSLSNSFLSNTSSNSIWINNGDGSFSGTEGDSFFDIAQDKDGQYKMVDIFSKNTHEAFENLIYNISKFVKENGSVNKSVYINDIIQNTLSSAEKAGWNIIDKTIKYNNVEVQIVAQFPKGNKELSKISGITTFMDKVYAKNSKGYVNMHGIALLSNYREMLSGAKDSFTNVRLLQIKSFNRQIIQTISNRITKP